MRIYLAGASAEIETCEHYRDRLRGHGFVITHDWMADARARQARGLEEHEVSLDERRATALRCLFDGIDDADLVWVLLPGKPSIGAWVELGYALSRSARDRVHGGELPIFTSGPCLSIFPDVTVRHATHEQAFAWLAAHRGGR